ncbi:MAG TPA: hypothetical protein VM364_12000 [Vicinamibacterales bacterium]|nr:hypothetical protein [Vicinamibacterales bacterium]
MVIRRVGVLSVAKMYAAISAAMGLLFGVFLALASLVGVSLGEEGQPAFVGVMFGAGAVVALPLFYGAMGFVMGAIGAAIYNLFAGVVGGVSIDVE